jgi:glycosyltransferase involved in cell wall biosynthesis
MRVIACNAAYNEGGIGRLFAALVEDARRSGELSAYYTTGAKANDSAAVEISLGRHRWLFRATPLRASHAWRDYVSAELFDRAVARALKRGDELTGFSGRVLRTFVRARSLGYSRLIVEASTSHVAHVRRRHEAAIKRHGIEGSWLNGAQFRKTIQEYEMADEIVVISEYSRQSFLEEGVPASKLRRRVQRVAGRFAPPLNSARRKGFTVVYVGRLQVTKGVVDLFDSFARIDDPDAELLLVGGPATRAMERYVTQRSTADGRIRLCPGDPLPALHRSDVLVHPSYEDALALGPLEALACGVPVIVSEDTGMKEFVVEGETGYVVPTGDVNALVTTLRRVQEEPLQGRLPDVCRA